MSGASGNRERAPRILAAALAGGARLAEVFEKTSRSLRCEFGPGGIDSKQWRSESGIALRVWHEGGREGMAHADASKRSAASLVADAGGGAAHHMGGPVPELPCPDRRDGDGQARVPGHGDLPDPGRGEGWAPGIGKEREAGRRELGDSVLGEPRDPQGGADSRPHGPGPGNRDGSDLDEIVRELASGIAASFAGPGERNARLCAGWIEIAEVETSILNSLGGGAEFGQAIAVVGALAARRDGRDEGEAIATVRHAIVSSGAELDAWLESIDAAPFAREASVRAGIAAGGDPIEGRGVPVLLERHAAAVWVRSWVPRLIGGTPAAGTAADAAQPLGREEGARGALEVWDEPHGAGIDGEGRRVLPRPLIRGGAIVGSIRDSREREGPGLGVGPMRRDTYRESPYPSPMHLQVLPRSGTSETMRRELGRGLLVTHLSPFSPPGAATLIAELRGAWVEGGEIVRPVGRTILLLASMPSALRLAAIGADSVLDASGIPVTTPSLLFEGADLRPL